MNGCFYNVKTCLSKMFRRIIAVKTMKVLFLFFLLYGIQSAAGEGLQAGEIMISPSGEMSLQKAVNLAKENDIIVMKPGIYEYKESVIIKNKKNLVIKGEGNVWIIVDDVYKDVIQIADSRKIRLIRIHAKHKDPLREYQCHGAVVSISGSKNIKIEKSELNGSGAVGVKANNSAKIHIKKCHIHHNSFCAVYMWRCNNVKILYNIIEDNKSFLSMYDTTAELYGNAIRNNRGYWDGME